MKPQSYDDWKADRAKAMAERTPYRVMLDAAYQAANQNDNFYAGLASRIEAREEAKMPIAGEGAVRFLTMASDVTKPLTRLGFPGLVIYSIFETTERIARFRSGINE
jgi:hypothetical protein